MNDFVQKPKPKVGILTTFYNFDSAYSLCSVVKQQLIALIRNGYTPVLFVLDIFKDEAAVPEGVEIRKIVPQLILEPYGKHETTNLEADVERAQNEFEYHMQDIDVMLCHDIIFINSYLPYNLALRKATETTLTNVKWLHWMHSGPSNRVINGSVWDNLYTLPKNSRLVYMNYTDVLRAAEHYGAWEKDVRTIFNPMDVRELHNFHPITRALIDRYDLMSPDILITYPLSTTRMGAGGKQLDRVIWIAGELKKLGKSVRLVVCNAHANADREKEAIEDMYSLATTFGLERREVVFTSLFDKPKLESGVPHEVVRDLLLLGNVFIFPSVSENCPLVLLEAMASKNLLVLNQSFPAMKDFAGNGAQYFRFGSLVDDPKYPSGIDLYMSDIAKIIVSELNTNRVLQANTTVRKIFNVDYIFKQQLEPAIMEIYYGN